MKRHLLEASPHRADGHRWAVVLAGGDGKRLLPLTRTLAGDDRPKQFCRVLGNESLLDQTFTRVSRVVSPRQTFAVLNKTHESFFRPGWDGRFFQPLVQPCNRGTSPAILYSLLRLRAADPCAVVGFFPSDHFFTDDGIFAASVDEAFASAAAPSSPVILIGIAPNTPETEYGWIEPGTLLRSGEGGSAFTIRRFWEKPSGSVAAGLLRRGCLWNSFIMVGCVTSFLDLIERSAPCLIGAFRPIVPALFTPDEEGRALDVYSKIPSSSFSDDVLATCPGDLAVLCNRRLEWADVGNVGRALAVREGALSSATPRIPSSAEHKTARAATAAG